MSSESGAKANAGLYVDYLARDVAKIVGCVVPAGRQGLPNLISTKQVFQPACVAHVSPLTALTDTGELAEQTNH